MTFATRRDDRAYIAEVLDEATRNSPHARVERVYGEAVALTPVRDGVRLQLDGLRHVDVLRAAGWFRPPIN